MPSDLTPTQLQELRHAQGDDPQARVLTNAVIKNGLNAVAQRRDRVTQLTHTFSHEIPSGAVTNQKKSGRCWLFAGLNLVRVKVAGDLKVKDFELSESYLMFYDKLEKANYFLEGVLETRDRPLGDRLVDWWLSYGAAADGGWWYMFANLVKKYGAVPQSVMPETFHSSDSATMNRLLAARLRDGAFTLRDQHQRGANDSDLAAAKSAIIADVYRMLVRCLGEPPEQFDFEYQDDDHHYHAERGLSPKEFYQRYADIHLDDYAVIADIPRFDMEMNRTYGVKFGGNMVGGEPEVFLNVSTDEMKQITQAALLDKNPVWFACDVGQWSDRTTGILDSQQFDYEALLGITLTLDKGNRLAYGHNQLTHAMVFTGVNLVDGMATRWKVENSWGKEPGHDGFFVMSDDWFNEYVYEVVVPARYLSETQRSGLTQPPIELMPWQI